jgi:4-amino-4-deoxy-L-arabinose transferase-like glycosyltransferase
MKIFFLILLLAHAAASLVFLSPLVRQFIWLTGLLGAFVWMAAQKTKEKLADEKTLGISIWFWRAIPLLALIARFFRFISAPVWPIGDECITAQAGFQLSHVWNWDFFRSDGESPPLLDWIVGAFFKVSNHIEWGLWFPSFVISCLTLVVVWQVGRRFFSRSQAFFLCFFWAISFWPVFCQGLALQETLLPLWEWILFWVWLSYGEAPASKRLGLAVFLGFWTGLGYWTYVPWPVVALALFVGIFYGWLQKRWNLTSLAGFCLGFAVALIPFALAVAQHGYGTHIGVLASTDGTLPLPRWLSSLDYFNSLFWGHWSAIGAYVPADMGLLNPVEAAFFWAGVWTLWNRKDKAFGLWIAMAFVLFMAPGFLSRNLQVLRMISVMPILLGVAALGASRMLQSFSSWKNRAQFLAAVLMVSLLFSGWQTARAFQQVEAPEDLNREQAKLSTWMSGARGPGLVFTEFNTAKEEAQNFQTMVYGFNAVQNPKLDPGQANWAAFWVTPDQSGYLLKQFKTLQVMPMKQDDSMKNDKYLLAIMPLGPGDAAKLQDYIQADQWFQKMTWESNDVSTTRSYQDALKDWLKPDLFFQKNNYLQWRYWERLAHFYETFDSQNHEDLKQQALRESQQALNRLNQN